MNSKSDDTDYNNHYELSRNIAKQIQDSLKDIPEELKVNVGEEIDIYFFDRETKDFKKVLNE